MNQPQILSKSSINELLATRGKGPAVTMYVPTNTSASPPNMSEDQIRSKNLFHQARQALPLTAEGKQVTDQLATQLTAMLNDQAFWKHPQQGLLICAEANRVALFYLPIDTEEYVAVGDTWHLAPIFSLLQDTQEYYVLAIAQHQPMLWQGSGTTLEPTTIELPASVAAGLNLDETNQKSEQQRSTEGANANGANFNGRGGARNPAEEDRHRYWRLIDHIITSKVDTSRPLVLAGVDSELAEYRAISQYPKILEGIISGNANNTLTQDLAAKANAVIQQEITGPAHASVAEDYQRLEGTQPERVASELTTIESAAESGRIDRLVINMMRRTTDTVRDNTEQVLVLSFQASQKFSQAIEAAALAVWQAGGRIINVEATAMPRNGALALATLRY